MSAGPALASALCLIPVPLPRRGPTLLASGRTRETSGLASRWRRPIRRGPTCTGRHPGVDWDPARAREGCGERVCPLRAGGVAPLRTVLSLFDSWGSALRLRAISEGHTIFRQSRKPAVCSEKASSLQYTSRVEPNFSGRYQKPPYGAQQPKSKRKTSTRIVSPSQRWARDKPEQTTSREERLTPRRPRWPHRRSPIADNVSMSGAPNWRRRSESGSATRDPDRNYHELGAPGERLPVPSRRS